MRKAVFALALASTVLATPSFARDGSTYAGIEGGILFGDGLEVDVDANGNGSIDDSEQNIAQLDTKRGFDVDAVLGHDFGMFRLEGEAAYKRAGIDNLTTTGGLDADPFTAGVQTSAAGSGHINVKSLMVNGLVDIGDVFYAGGGVGYGWVNLDSTATGANTAFVDDSDGGLAWQLIAGLHFPVSDSVDLGLKYRYFNVEDLNMVSPGNSSVETDFKSHSVLASLLFNFGGVAVPPPPPVMIAPAPAPYTPPPPPPQTRTCPDGSVVMMSQSCPVPPPPPAIRTGERG